MNVAIIGYGEQGRSSAEYWQKRGDTVTICDQDEDVKIPDGASSQLGINYLSHLNDYDLLVRSPSVHPSTIFDANQNHPDIAVKITSNTNEFFRVCPAPIVGVTGTKGKGTTSSLIAKILEASGKKVHIGGNIGTPPLDLLKNNISENDIVVMELANFQLIDMLYSPKIAVCLMIVEEHLDWHKDFFEYVNSKKQIFSHQEASDIAVYNSANVYSTELAGHSHAHTKISYCVPEPGQAPEDTTGVYLDGEDIKIGDTKVCSTKDIKLPGRHNIENVCAAIAATWNLVNKDAGVIVKAIKEFSGLPHRIETVDTINSITYVDDSFGTNPATAVVALNSFKQPIILIAGGSDKGTSYQPVVDEIIKQKVKHLVAIGETGPKIIDMLEKTKGGENIPHTYLDTSTTMDEIVKTATKEASKGDVVLLSTASASFDMFKNYKERGIQFKTAVKNLK